MAPPWRNWADKARCHKCRLPKGSCFMRPAGAGGGSPTVSLRQQGKPAAPSGPAAANPPAQAVQGKAAVAGGQAAAKAIAEVKLLTAKVTEVEAKVASGGPVAVTTAPDKKEQDAFLSELRVNIAKLEGVCGGESLLASKAELE